MFNNIIIRASAGSGKTFQLSNRYLDLAFGGVRFDAVLASTFTKKAAGEILDRILIRLAEAATEEKKRIALSEGIASGRDIARNEILETLASAVRNLHRLRIGTLDSFFIQIAGSFCLELGISPGWSIVEELDDRRYLGEAVRKTFAESRTDDAVRLMHLLSKGEVSRSVTEQALSLSRELIGLFRDAPRNAWEKLPKRPLLSPGELFETLEQFKNVPLPADKRFAAAREKDWQRALDGDWPGFLESGFPSKILQGESTYYSKPIDGEFAELVRVLVEHAKAELINKLAIQTEATGDLLERVFEQYERIKQENRALRFDDVTFRLTDSRLHDRLEQIVHRIDAPTRHLLLDEFQDTSPMQWEVLRPFALSAIESHQKSGGSFFCVGDVKQAIYGWRGGVAEIFETIENEIRPLTKQGLNRSWRSAPPVIEMVNDLFGKLANNAALLEPEDLGDAAREWETRFEPHQTARTELSGYCTLETAPLYDPNRQETELALPESNEDDADDGEKGDTSQSQTTLRFAITRIAELHRESPGATLGVLVRRNQTVARLIFGLKRLGIEASEEGGNPLTDSPAVEIVLSALTFADHPGDSVCRYHLATGPLGKVLGLSEEGDESQATAVSQKIRESLSERGYGAVIGDWVAAIAPSCDRRDLDRLLQLLSLGYSWESRATVRADRFVDWIRSTKVESPSAAKVRVMTIHQSKGLQFDIVVLPELEGKLIGQPPSVVVGRKHPNSGRPDPTAPIDRVLRYTNETVQTFLPLSFKQMFADFRRERVEESLCLLYVAITRAIHRLVMIVPPLKPTKSAPKPRKTFDGVLRCGLLAEGDEDRPEAVLYQQGAPKWFEKCDFATEPRPREEESFEIMLKKNRSPRRNLPRIAPSGLEGQKIEGRGQKTEDGGQGEDGLIGTGFSSDSFQPLGFIPFAFRKNALLWGTAIHACFEKGLADHPWLDEALPKRNELERLVREAVQSFPEKIDPKVVVDAFLAICEKPGVRAALSLRKYRESSAGLRDPNWEAFAERPFAVRTEEGILRGSIDRLVITTDGGKAVRAEILDFKTDAFDPERGISEEAFLAERKAVYAPQLNAYRKAVARLHRLPPAAIEARLLLTSLGRTAEIANG